MHYMYIINQIELIKISNAIDADVTVSHNNDPIIKFFLLNRSANTPPTVLKRNNPRPLIPATAPTQKGESDIINVSQPMAISAIIVPRLLATVLTQNNLNLGLWISSSTVVHQKCLASCIESYESNDKTVTRIIERSLYSLFKNLSLAQ